MRPVRVLSLLAGWLVAVMVVAGVSWQAIGSAGRQIGVVPAASVAAAPGSRDLVAPTGAAGQSGEVGRVAGDGVPGGTAPVGASGPANPATPRIGGEEPGAFEPSAPGIGRPLGLERPGHSPGNAGPESGAPASSSSGLPDSSSSWLPARSSTGPQTGPPNDPSNGRTGASAGAPSTRIPGGAVSTDGTGGAPARGSEPAEPETRPAAETTRTGAFSDPAGQILLACVPAGATSWSALPAAGWSAQAVVAGPAAVRVWFTQISRGVAVVARCEAGHPRFERGEFVPGVGAGPGDASTGASTGASPGPSPAASPGPSPAAPFEDPRQAK